MSNPITPTIGRKVWYYEAQADAGCYSTVEPYDATIIHVWGPDMVSLRVTKHAGDIVTRTSIPLRGPDPGDVHGTGFAFATWMPFQVGQQRVQQSEIEKPKGDHA